MLDKSFIEKIENMAETKVIEIGGRSFSSKPMYSVDAPVCETLEVSSLDSLVSLICAESNSYEKAYVIVRSPIYVEVKTGFFGNKQRDTLYSATAEVPYIQFGTFIPIEEMIINLKSKFEETADREYLIGLLGNISDEQSIRTTDDGITQQATVKSGIQLQQKENVRAIVRLKPYRTFTDVEQPDSDFLIRLRNGQAALFEADGGAWKKQARENVAGYLSEKLKEVRKVIIAK